MHVLDRKVLFKEGEPAQQMFLVKRGAIICLKKSKDRLIPIFTANSDDIIGESAMLENGLHSYSAIALTDSELVEIPASHFKTVFDKSPEWIVDFTQTMVNRFQNTANLIAENRIIHPSLTKEGGYSDRIEIEFKKLLA